MDGEKRFDSEYRKRYFEFNPERPEERTECKFINLCNSHTIVIIEDGMIVNPYLQKRHKGKKIVKDNPLFKKDIMNTSAGQAANKNVANPPAEMLSSTSDKFSKQLGQHGYLKHTNKAPSNYMPPQKYQPEYAYNQDDTASQSFREDQEPYRREAGKTTQPSQQLSQSFKNPSHNRDLGSRNINRRIVEENLLRNASADRGLQDTDKSFRDKGVHKEHSFQPSYNTSLDHKMQEFYKNQTQKFQSKNGPQDDPYHMRNPSKYAQQNEEDQEQTDEERRNEYMSNLYAKHQNRDEVTQTPDANESNPRQEMRRELPPRSRDVSLQRNQTVKYHPPQQQKTVQIKAPEYSQQEQNFDVQSRMSDNRSKEVHEDISKYFCTF